MSYYSDCNSIQLSSSRASSTSSPRRIHSPNQLTRENLKTFEKQQQRIELERKRSKTPSSPSIRPSSESVQRSEPRQVFILDRIEDVDELKNENKFQCCCRCTTVYKGAWMVGLLEALFAFIALIIVIINYTRLGYNYFQHFMATVGLCVCYMVVLTLHFCGLQGKLASMLIPNLLLQLITMVLFIITSVFIGVTLTSSDQSSLVIWAGWGPLYGDLAREAGWTLFTVGAVLIACCLMAFVLYIWFFYISFMCYRYLNEQTRKRRALVYNESSKIISTATTPVP